MPDYNFIYFPCMQLSVCEGTIHSPAVWSSCCVGALDTQVHNSVFQTPRQPWAHADKNQALTLVTPAHSTRAHGLSGSMHTFTHVDTEPSRTASQKPPEGIDAGPLTVRHRQHACRSPPLPAGVLATAGSKLSGKPQRAAHSESCRLQTLGVQSSLVQRQKAGGGECGAQGGKEGTLHANGLVGVDKEEEWPEGRAQHSPWTLDRSQHCSGCLIKGRHVPARPPSD